MRYVVVLLLILATTALADDSPKRYIRKGTVTHADIAEGLTVTRRLTAVEYVAAMVEWQNKLRNAPPWVMFDGPPTEYVDEYVWIWNFPVPLIRVLFDDDQSAMIFIVQKDVYETLLIGDKVSVQYCDNIPLGPRNERKAAEKAPDGAAR